MFAVNCITFWDVESPRGQVTPGGFVILGGDGPVWKYCLLYHRAIAEGAAVVAVAHGIDTKVAGGSSIVAWSTDPDYRIGNTLNHDDERKRRNDPLRALIKEYGVVEGTRIYHEELAKKDKGDS